MIYVHIVREDDEYLIPMPIMRFFGKTVKVSSEIGQEEYRLSCKSIQKISVISDPDDLNQILAQIVNKRAKI